MRDGLTVLTVAFLLLGALPAQAQPRQRYDVSVTIPMTNEAGQKWDRWGGPDVVLCVRTSEIYDCNNGNLFNETKRPSGLRKSCNDMHMNSCTIHSVKIPSGRFEMQVIDKDTFSHDVIGTGSCDPAAGVCYLGTTRLDFKRKA